MDDYSWGYVKLIGVGEFIREQIALGAVSQNEEAVRILNDIEKSAHDCEMILDSAGAMDCAYKEAYCKLSFSFRNIASCAISHREIFLGDLLILSLDACDMFMDISYEEWSSILNVMAEILRACEDSYKNSSQSQKSKDSNIIYLSDYLTLDGGHKSGKIDKQF